MASLEVPEFENLVNFRKLPETNIYRSARPDKMTSTDIDKLTHIGVKRIFDFRSCSKIANEYKHNTKDKLVDDTYQAYLLQEVKYNQLEYVKIDKQGRPLKGQRAQTSCSDDYAHFLCPLISSYSRGVFGKTSMYKQCVVVILYIIDTLFRSQLAVRFLMKNEITPKGLLGLYIDIIQYCGRDICTVLKLLSEKNNTPALVCCLIGKDRTGLIAALILSVVGADKTIICQDYATSQEFYDSYIADVIPLFKRYGMDISFADANYETMMQLLDYVENRYGSVRQYLHKIGFDAYDQDKLASNIKLT